MAIRDLIYKHADNKQYISQGLAYYQKGEVRNLQVAPFGSTEGEALGCSTAIIADAQVVDASPMVILDGETLRNAYCTCSEFRDSDHLCKHLVALLRALPDRLLPETPHQQPERLNALLDAYRRPGLPTGVPDLHHTVQLMPTLDFDPYSGRFNLSFQIGTDKKLYIIKSLSLFHEHMTRKAVHQYGKHLMLLHRRDQFTDEAQYYIDLIDTAMTMSGGARLSAYRSDRNDIGRYLPLSEQLCDDFLRYVSRQSAHLLCRRKSGETGALTVLDAAPELEFFVIARSSDTYTLSLKAAPYRLLRNGRHMYLFNESLLIRPSSAYQRDVLPLYEAFVKNGDPSMVLSRDELATFIAVASPRIREHAALHIDDALLNALAPPPLKINVRLDYPGVDTVRGLLTFHYGNASFNPLGPEEDIPAHIYRTVQEEDAFLDMLRDLRFSRNEDELLLVGEDALYLLLHEGLAQLMAHADIEVENRLERMRPQRLGPLHMNAAMTDGIITLSLDEQTYDKDVLVETIRAYRKGKSYIRLTNETFLDIVNPMTKRLDMLLEDCSLPPEALADEHLEMPLFRAANLIDLEDNTLGDIRLDYNEALTTLIERIARHDDHRYPLPETLHAELRPYQYAGYCWLVQLAELGMGGILADDMGLGKTVQTIAYLLNRQALAPDEMSIVVAPTSLIYNWQAELDRFAPSLRYRLINGSVPERTEALQAVKPGELLLTSYSTLRRDKELYESLRFNTVIADEGQYVKNSYTQNARALKSLHAKHRFALTGTPMENALSDLWSIMDFCMPGYLLNRRRFKNIYEIPIARHEDHERLAHLKEQTAPFILRRIKKDVLKDLPDKIETVLYADLSTEERRIYYAQLALSRKTFVEELAANDITQNRVRVLALLTRLRQICCSPALFLEGFNKPSSKLDLCMDVLTERLASGSRVILFSQFTSMLDLIAAALNEAGIPYLLLTGQTKSESRMELVRRFNRKECAVFLISLKAGGVGLNLTAADTVIHYDPWWNQSAENQATDRTHRIGQDKTVHVIKLICKNTIEEKILILKEKKQHLSDAVVGQNQTFMAGLSERDIASLFEMPQ